MSAFSWLTIAMTSIVIALAVVWHVQQRSDALRRERAKHEYNERKRKQELEQFLGRAARYFPFIGSYLKPRLDAGLPPEKALAAALEDVPGAKIGITEHGLSVGIPLSERRKHLYCPGKSGFGKTSTMTTLIAADLAEGRGLAAVAPEAEWFRDWLLPLTPEARAKDCVYFRPADPSSPVCYNPLQLEPGDDQSRAAAELAIAFRRALREEQIGVRTGPIIQNLFGALVGRRGATLSSIISFLQDESYRAQVIADCDPYIRNFWAETYPRLPKSSGLPIIYRLDSFLRPRAVRNALCSPVSSFSIRRALAESHILYFDLSGLDEDSQLLLGSMLMSRFQTELFRRESIPQSQRTQFHLYLDEFQTCASAAEDAWRTMLSRGRRMGLGITLANQHPGQLSKALQDEIFGNVSSLVVFNLSSADAASIRKELLVMPPDGDVPEPIAAEQIISLKVGHALCRFGSGSYALPVALKEPIPEQPKEVGEKIRTISWATYGSSDAATGESETVGEPGAGAAGSRPETPIPIPSPGGTLSAVELRFLTTVVENPGQPSAEYARALGLNGTRAARIRRALVEQGYLREHKLARKAQGKPAVILEPLDLALRAVTPGDRTPS